MDFDNHLLGKGVTRTLLERREEILFSIGSDAFTRRDLSKVECYNFPSAKNPHFLKRLEELKVRHTRDLFYNHPPDSFAVPKVGSYVLAVLGAAFQAKNLGGKEPLQGWVDAHKMDAVTFNTLKMRKVREADQIAQEKKERKRRAAAAKKEREEEARVERTLSKAARHIHVVPSSPRRLAANA